MEIFASEKDKQLSEEIIEASLYHDYCEFDKRVQIKPLEAHDAEVKQAARKELLWELSIWLNNGQDVTKEEMKSKIKQLWGEDYGNSK